MANKSKKITISLREELIKERTCIWNYTAKILRQYGLKKSTSAQLIFIKWLKENNKTIIENEHILKNRHIITPSSKKDLIYIIGINELLFSQNPEFFDVYPEIEENLVIIGANVWRGGNAKGYVQGIFGFDVDYRSKMMFVHQALREVRKNNTKKWTVLICKEGYTKSQMHAIEKAFYDKNIMRDSVLNILILDGMQSSIIDKMINYINYGDLEFNEYNKRRKYVKVSHISIYSHGMPKGFYFWLDEHPRGGSGKCFDNNSISKLKESAFTKNSEIYSYACRTGIGNSDIDEEWNFKDDLMVDKSVAQALANATGATVYSYLKRTSYEDTLVKPDDRNIIEKWAEASDRDKENPIYKKLHEIWETDNYKVDGDIFYPEGAFNPVRAYSTPKNLPDEMIEYKRK